MICPKEDAEVVAVAAEAVVAPGEAAVVAAAMVSSRTLLSKFEFTSSFSKSCFSSA